MKTLSAMVADKMLLEGNNKEVIKTFKNKFKKRKKNKEKRKKETQNIKNSGG